VDQPVTVLTDGGDSVRALVDDLPAGAEHVLEFVRRRGVPAGAERDATLR
jgi:hypothetical protein